MLDCNFCGSAPADDLVFKGTSTLGVVSYICESCLNKLEKMKLENDRNIKARERKAISARNALSAQINHSFKIIDGGKT